MDDIQCADCGTSFRPGRRTQKFCSKPCKVRFLHREWVRRNPERAKEIDAKSHGPKRGARNERVKAWRQENRELVLITDRVRHLDRMDEVNPTRLARYYADHEANKCLQRMRGAQARLAAPWMRLLRGAQDRAEKKGLKYSLSPEWAVARWTGRCELTDIEFKVTTGERRTCFSPSIDRVEPTKGYTPDNSRFVLWAINAMKDIGSYADVIEIAKAIVLKNP